MSAAVHSPITFAASDVERSAQPCPEVPYVQRLAAALEETGEPEAYSRDTRPLTAPFPHRMPSPFDLPVHAFIGAVNLAYDQHYPLTLSPDMIWLLIAQGFAQQVRINAKTLRSRFVAHECSLTLKVRRDEFVRGFAGNDWEGVFAEFSTQIRQHIGTASHDLLVPRFSTTGPVERAAFEVTLLEAMASYFDYLLVTRCGIPEFTLEGTEADWDAVRSGAEKLAAFDLEWWTQHLLPVLNQFVAARRGQIDRTFWQAFYKLEHGSGGPYISGHIVNLFPYLVPKKVGDRPSERHIAEEQRLLGKTREQIEENYAKLVNLGVFRGIGERGPYRNPYLGRGDTVRESGKFPEGMTSRELPPGLSLAPFLWDYYGTRYPMEFVSGFVGVSQTPDTLSLRPKIGWAVRDRKEG